MAPQVMLVDFENYRPPPEYQLVGKEVEELYLQQLNDTVYFKAAVERGEKEVAEKEAEDIVNFQKKVFQRSGVSENDTFLPPSLNPKFCGLNPRTDLNAAYEEFSTAVFPAVEGLLNKTGLRPQDIDIVISTCSIYCPTPSMASAVVNHFKMRSNVQSYHLGGMGCANGVVAINLVADLLKARPNSNCIFITHETTTPVFYFGRDKHRLVTNMLFRMGASAQLLSNKPSMASKAKYKLVKAYRIHTGANDSSYSCIYYGPDDEGINGVALQKEVIVEASKAMTLSLKNIAPHIMTWSQIAAYLATEARRKIAKATGAGPVPPPYQPAFNKGVQHFLLHAGGAKVLDGLGAGLKLNETDLEPSRKVLHDYGNVSSSTTWYSLGFIETMKGVKQGDIVMQVGVGSGIKCGVNIWQALRDVDDLHVAWDRRVTPDRRTACQVRQHDTRLPRALLVLRVLLLLALLVVSVTAFAVLSHGPAADQARAVLYRAGAWGGMHAGHMLSAEGQAMNTSMHAAGAGTPGLHADL